MSAAADQQLKESVEREVLACIGCNDCLLACPIVESRHVTIADLNGAVHLPTITDANVARFVTACTQCRQCVPACPADLNRADMVLLNKLKLEDSIPDHELMLQARTVVFASGMTLDGLSQKLGELQLFRGASPVALRRLVLKSTLRMLVPGEYRFSLAVGDEVVTTSGLFGTIVAIDDKVVTLDAGAGQRLRYDRRAIGMRAAEGV
jgi:ferredoxin